MNRLLTLLCFVLVTLSTVSHGQQLGSAWPKARQNNFNSGVGIGGGSNGVARWHYTTGASISSSAAVAADGTIYVGSEDFNLYALNPNGSLKWSFQTAGSIYAAPAIGSDGTIYIGSTDGALYALTPAGAVKWSYQTQGAIASSVSFDANGGIYFGSEDYNVYALNIDGSLKWSFPTGNYVDSSPGVAPDGTVYVGSADGNLYAITAAGTSKWSFASGSVIWAAPSIAIDGTIYFGSSDNNLYALNSDGSLKWSFATQSYIDSSQAIGPDGTIYVGSSDGSLYAIQPDGTQKWAFLAGDSIESSPCVGLDGTIYFAADDSQLYAVKPDGTLRWTYRTGAAIYADPIIAADGAVIVGSTDSSVYVVGTGVNTVPVSKLVLTPTSVLGGLAVKGTVSLLSAATAGGDVVLLSSPSALVSFPAIVTVPAGAQSVDFAVSTASVLAASSATISAASGGKSVSSTLQITASGLATVSVAPSAVVGGLKSVGTVTLGAVAPNGGTTVSLVSDNPIVTVPQSVTVLGGQKSATFTVDTTPTQTLVTATLTATQGAQSLTTKLTVQPAGLVSVALDPASVLGGSPSTGTVTLSGPAPAGGIAITLISSVSSVVPPSTITIPAGANSASFTVTTQAVSTPTQANVTAKLAATQVTATLTVTPPALTALSMTPNVVIGGANSVGTITINGPAPLGGLVVSLAAGNAAVTVPSAVTIAAGLSSASFVIKTATVANSIPVTITASQGVVTKTATLTLNPAALLSISIVPSALSGGNRAIGTVYVSGAAPTNGISISLKSSTKIAVVPPIVNVPSGASSATFVITTSATGASTIATISGTFSLSTKTASLAINPAALTSVSVSPSRVAGGGTSIGTVTLDGIAPTAGLTIGLTSSSTNAVVPATVRVLAGMSSATFKITSRAVSVESSVTISAKLGSVVKSATLTITPPSLIGFTVAPASAIGGALPQVIATVSLDGVAASTGQVITLTSSDGTVASVPTTVKVPSGAKTATVKIVTFSVATQKTVTLTASSGNITLHATLQVLPPTLSSISITPAVVKGSATTLVTGVVTISNAAPVGGLTISLSSSESSIGSVPQSVVIPSGKTSASFKVGHSSVVKQTIVTITAGLNGAIKTGKLTVNP